MQEIKFRAWLKIEHRWADVDELLGHLPVKYFYKPQAVLRFGNGNRMYDINLFSGLKDKKGKEIYEKDIVNYGADPSVVVFENGCFWSRAGQYELYIHRDIEVIGNIYENPELLR